MTVRTRFAPSPTGELHAGNARIAVLNWLYARHTRGNFVLRIEDTDLERNVPGAEGELISTLRRLGLDWDEGPDAGGDFAPYRQSERVDLYREQAGLLLGAGRAFRCYCSPEEIAAKRRAAIDRGEEAIYDGTCRDLSPDHERGFRDRGIEPSIRFIVPPGEVVVRDLPRGDVVFDSAEFGDFVILKSDGLPTYNFAVVVDDIAMQITHVIRGVGHLTNTPRQLMIYQALGSDAPVFVHVPHVLAPGGKALSKREGARTLREYLDDGYHPDALINYLSLLSWSSPTGDEFLPPQRLIDEIDLGRIGVSDVTLDPDKLDWLSGEYIRQMDSEELALRLGEFFDAPLFPEENGQGARIALAVRDRITTFSGADRLLIQLHPPDPMQWSDDALGVLEGVEPARVLEAVHKRLSEVTEWEGRSAMEAIRAAGGDVGVKGRALFMPVRAALTGDTKGPELPDILAIQGQETALRVLEQSLAHLRET